MIADSVLDEVSQSKFGLIDVFLFRIQVSFLWTHRCLLLLLSLAFHLPRSQPTEMVCASRVTISIYLMESYDLILFLGEKSKVAVESLELEKILVVDEYEHKVGGKLMEMRLLNARLEDYMKKRPRLMTLFY